MAETTAHTAAPAGHAKFPPFESEHFPSQLVWLAISFVLLYVLMSRIALPRIGGIMAARNKVISDDLAAAEQLKERSNAANAAYEKALADARSRAQAIAGATREQQARETEDLHKRLEAQLHDRMVAAEQSIAKKARRGDEQCEVNRGRDRFGHRRTTDRAAAARRGHCRRARRHRQKLKRQFTHTRHCGDQQWPPHRRSSPNFRSQIPDQLAE
jgi:F-type H+-transporting ATPase subunit b